MAHAPKPEIDPDDAPLKRLGGGRWQTRDERFTIEPQSGTWVVTDAEQTDELGMALVRGPFPSLTAAKSAISTARTSAPAASPLADRIERRRSEPPSEPHATKPPAGRGAGRAREASGGARSAPPADEPAMARTDRPAPSPRSGSTGRTAARHVDVSRDPAWLNDLGAADRGRARRLIARLRDDGTPDAEGLVRRDLLGDVPALAAHAIATRLEALGDDASPREVADLLADGRDDALGVRWRLVDGDGRPVLVERGAGRKR